MKLAVFVLLILAATVSGCFRPVIPISTGPKFPIDIFYNDQRPERPFDVLQELRYEQETALTAEQKVRKGVMIKRGKGMLEKDILLAQLVVDAQKVGATAVMNVRYKYFTTATDNGYSLEGTAIRYRGNDEL